MQGLPLNPSRSWIAWVILRITINGVTRIFPMGTGVQLNPTMFVITDHVWRTILANPYANWNTIRAVVFHPPGHVPAFILLPRFNAVMDATTGDMVLLVLETPHDLPQGEQFPEIDWDMPLIGDTITTFGYRVAGLAQQHVDAVVTGNTPAPRYPTIEITAAFVPGQFTQAGDSGAAVLRNNRLIGLHTGEQEAGVQRFVPFAGEARIRSMITQMPIEVNAVFALALGLTLLFSLDSGP
jgi:hypothetical protein